MAVFKIKISNHDLLSYLIKHSIRGNGFITKEDVSKYWQNSQFLIFCQRFEVISQELVQAKHFVIFQSTGAVNFKFIDSNKKKFLPFIFLFKSMEVIFLSLRLFLLLGQKF